jgi:hypothetical protein
MVNIPEEVYTNYILKYIVKPPMKLLDWIDINKLNWLDLSKNPVAIDLLKANNDMINWNLLSLKANNDMINWDYLSCNESAMELLKENQHNIYWDELSAKPYAIDILKEKQDKINWFELSQNPGIFEIDNVKWTQLIQSYYDNFIKND